MPRTSPNVQRQFAAPRPDRLLPHRQTNFASMARTEMKTALKGRVPIGETKNPDVALTLPKCGHAVEHRMDRLNRTPRPAQSEWSALIADGLILWRLSTPGQSDLWCLVFEHPDGFCFVLDDDPEGT